jgi:hypothetical protein
MSKWFRDFFSPKRNRNDSKANTGKTIYETKQVEEGQEIRPEINLTSLEEFSKMQKKQAEELLKILPSWQELYAYLLTSINKSVVKAKNMEIITGYSANINATISDSYDDVIQAILAKPDKEELKIDKMVVRILKPSAGITEDAVVKKTSNELTCDKIIARTWMGIDGDIIMLLPATDPINPELLELHRANVDLSLQNWRYILETVVKVIALLSPFIPGSQQASPPQT